jgi:hypothetical protein
MNVGFAMPAITGVRLRTALAVGSLALLPALGWQAGSVNSPAVAAPVPVRAVAETVIGKQTVTWTHKKADRAIVGAVLDDSPDVVVEVITLESGLLPGDGDGEATALLEQGSVDPVDRSADRQAFAGWLSFDHATGSARIIGFDTLREAEGRRSCRQTHDTIVAAFEIDPARARVLADQPVMFQSSICAANGEIVITCHGSSAVVSPRRSRPGGRCSRG